MPRLEISSAAIGWTAERASEFGPAADVPNRPRDTVKSRLIGLQNDLLRTYGGSAFGLWTCTMRWDTTFSSKLRDNLWNPGAAFLNNLVQMTNRASAVAAISPRRCP